MSANGDVIYGTGASTVARLAVGSTDQVLTVAAGVPAWAAGSKKTLTATGDLLYASAANTLARRGIGSSGDVLTVSGGVPTWAAPSSAGTTYRKTTSKTVNTSTAETDLLNGEITLAALSTTNVVRLTTIGLDHFNNSGGNVNFRWKLKLGATTVFDTGNLLVGAGANRGSIYFTATCENAGATNSQIWSGFVAGLISGGTNIPANVLTAGQGGAPGGTATVGALPWQATSAENTSTSKALTLTITMGTSSANAEAKLLGAIVVVE